MGKETAIEWTDHTFNPWIGCTKVSAACDHCYAETLMDTRWGKVKWGAGEKRVRTSEANWRQPLAWDRAAKAAGIRRRVFCASLADVFDNEVEDGWRFDLMQVIRGTPNLDWLLLTKRPQVAAKWWRHQAMPDNIWLGTTVEDQKMADLRIPILFDIPTKVRFLSVEPMLGRIFVPRYSVDWIIVGGESGAGARPMNLSWAEEIQRDCKETGIAFFMKQLGGARDKRDRLEDFPAPLRVREFPVIPR